jgi:hypothetical protein
LPEVQRPEGDIVEHRWTEQLVITVLKQQAHACTDGQEVALAAAGLTERDHLAGIGPDQADQDMQQRRLTGPVGTDQRDAITFAEPKIHAAQHGLTFAGETQPPELQYGCGLIDAGIIACAGDAVGVAWIENGHVFFKC